MNYKLISFLLGSILAITPNLLDAVTVIYPTPAYYYTVPVLYRDDPGAIAAGAAAGALLGLGLGALMSMDNYTFDHTCWLYFSNDILVQWGRPEDWKKESDHVQEIRYR